VYSDWNIFESSSDRYEDNSKATKTDETIDIETLIVDFLVGYIEAVKNCEQICKENIHPLFEPILKSNNMRRRKEFMDVHEKAMKDAQETTNG